MEARSERERYDADNLPRENESLLAVIAMQALLMEEEDGGWKSP